MKPRKWQVSTTSRDRLRTPGEGLRVGELCGLHLVDLHLRENAACGECRSPHLHVGHRPGNPNGAEAKTKHPWRSEHGTVTGGLVKRVSPAMVHAYFEYVTGEYPRGAGHGMLLVQLHGPDAGQPWAPVAARRMLARAGKRAGLGIVKPHAFRHSFTSTVLDAAGGNLLIARDAGGWASAATVHEVYGHVDVWELSFGLWDDLVDVGLRSHFVASAFAARSMVTAGRGLIVNVASHAAAAGKSSPSPTRSSPIQWPRPGCTVSPRTWPSS